MMMVEGDEGRRGEAHEAADERRAGEAHGFIGSPFSYNHLLALGFSIVI